MLSMMSFVSGFMEAEQEQKERADGSGQDRRSDEKCQMRNGKSLSPPVSCSCRLPSDLYGLTGSVTGSPGPLEVISPEVTCHIHYLTDEVES
jgi:hypothetical protein